MNAPNKNFGPKGHFNFAEVFGYFFRKRDPNRKTNINLKMMHGINKITIIIFLAGLIYLISKYIF